VHKHFGGEFDEVADLDFICVGRGGALCRYELESAHAARSGVAEALDGVEIDTGATLGREPGIDQGIAIFVRQCIGKHAG